MAIDRITESELILPALYLMTLKENHSISTTDLINQLTDIMKPNDADRAIIANRNDSYFSQKVRNLKSHNTLVKKSLAQNIKDGFKLTDEGLKYVIENFDNINYILSNDFTYIDKRSCFKQLRPKIKERRILALNEIISEGATNYKKQKVYTRSAKLRNTALEHYSHNGIIACDCCGFEAKTFYGPVYGEKDCIELHHLRPIFMYDDGGLTMRIEDAINNLLPVCPNCHRVIHKFHIEGNAINDLKRNIISPFRQ